jgi:hypothetical protein
MTNADWWGTVRSRRDREAPLETSLLWCLRKGEQEVRSELRIMDGVGDELRFLGNGEFRVSQLFKTHEGSQLLEASEEKRKDLVRRGWLP